MTQAAHHADQFSLTQTRKIVADLFRHRPWIYWTDWLLSLFVGVFCFTVVHRGHLIRRIEAALGSESQLLHGLLVAGFFLLSAAAFYRAALFIHEIVHFRKDSVPGFSFAWNLLTGIPFLMPSFLYRTHAHHHMRKHYGTAQDGEYLPLARSHPVLILLYLAQSFVIPPVAAVRFMLLTPLTWWEGPLRRWVFRHLSSMVINPKYVRPEPTRKELRIWRLQEAGCFVYGWTLCALLLAGVLPWTWLVQAYLTASTVLLLNSVRTLGAHYYRFTGQEVTFLDQLLDSVNYPHNWLLGEVWAPVGLRYHALHHLFPSMPYHNLGTAHRRLMAQLPPDSPYRQTVSPGLWATVSCILREAWQYGRGARAGQQTPSGSLPG